MKLGKIKLPLFYQYLLSYIIVLLIPLSIVGATVYAHFVDLLKHQVTTSNRQMLIQMRDVSDAQMKAITKISVKVSSLPDLSPYRLENFHNAYRAKNLLGLEGNEFIENMLLYMRGGKYLFSASTSYTVSLFYHSMFQYQNWTYDDFHETLNQLERPLLRTAEVVKLSESRQGKYITYLTPIPVNSIPYGTAVFLINENSFRDMLSTIMKYKDGNAFILNERGEVITALTDADYVRTPTFKDMADQATEEGLRSIRLNERDYYLSRIKSDLTGWTFLTLVPVSELMRTVDDVRNKALIALAIILAVGCAFIFLSLRANYSPIGRLLRTVEDKWGQTTKHYHGFDKIHHAMDAADTESRRLKSQVQSGQALMRQHMLIRLLKGQIKNRQALNEQGEEMGLVLSGAAYFVMILSFEPPLPESFDKHVFTNSWMNLMPDEMDIYEVELYEPNQAAFIVSDVQAPWEELHRRYTQSHRIHVTIGIGSAYEDFSMIGKSFLEATTAIQYKLIKGMDKVIDFQETAAGNPHIQWYPERELENLKLYLKQGNCEPIMNTADAVIDTIKQSSTTLFMAKCLCFEVISIVMRAMPGLLRSEEGRQPLPDVLSLTEYNSSGELESLVKEVCVMACEEIRDRKRHAGKERDLLQDMLRYLERQVSDSQFSVQSMAEHYSLSTAYLRRYFKEKTGKTISESIHSLRLEMAKGMLRETDMQLQDIVAQIGYTDVSSFIRKFKQDTGITPGEYRKLHQEPS